MKRLIAENKKAKFDYEISETLEAGVVLEGREVKSMRLGRVSLREAFARIYEGQAYLHNMNVAGYKYADLNEYEPTRRRKLLLNKKEIEGLEAKLKNTGTVLVPMEVYWSGRVIKVLLGLGKGRKRYQKKELLKRRDVEREVRREFKEKVR